MKPLVYLLLLSGLAGTACRNDRTQPVEQEHADMIVPPFHFAYYDYGGPPEPYYDKAQKAIFKQYGIAHKNVGCVITDSLVGASHRHNDSLFARLQPKFPGLTEERLLLEMQDYVTTQKAIEGTINPWLKRHIRHCVPPNYYPDIDWTVADSTNKQYLTRVFLYEPKSGKREGPVFVMLVTPATGDFLLKQKDGQWNECTK